MPDYSALMADWQALLARRPALGEPLRFWTAILEGWAAWKPPASLVPLGWSADECRGRWERGVSLLAEARPVIPSASVEELLGPVMERLAADGPEAVEAFQRLALAWDEGQIGAGALLPAPDRDPAAWLLDRFGLGAHLGAFLPVTALRPALEIYFDGVRALPDGVWTRGSCPWCGGAAGYGDLLEDGRRRLSCHLCGGAWIAARLRCPFCESWNSRDLARLVAEDLEAAYFIEGCRACRGYVKGVDRRQRWNAGPPRSRTCSRPRPETRGERGALRRGPDRLHPGRGGRDRLAGRPPRPARVGRAAADPGRLHLPHRRGDPAGHRAPSSARLDPRRDGLAADLGRDLARLLGRAPAAHSPPQRLRAPGRPGPGPRAAHRAPLDRARATGAQRLDHGARGAGAGGTGRARAEFRRRADVPAGGAPAQGQAGRRRVLSPAAARDARPAHDRHPHRRLPVPHGGPRPRGALGPRGVGQRGRLRPARPLLAGDVGHLHRDAPRPRARALARPAGRLSLHRRLLRDAGHAERGCLPARAPWLLTSGSPTRPVSCSSRG